MTPRQRVIRAGLLALLGFLDGFIDWKEIEAVLRPLATVDQSLGARVRPIIMILLEEYDEP